jgi:hypothetical protein
VGDSLIAPGYSFLLTPSGVADDTPVRLTVTGLDAPDGFASGLAPDGDGYTLRAGEVRVATFGVFGRFTSDRIELSGPGGAPSELQVVTLDGPLKVGPTVRRRWVSETARAIAAFYAGFPGERAMLTLIPVAGRGSVLHGKVLPESSPGIALMLGSEAGPEDLYADWILTHELFHLGFPSFVGEGKWLDEGVATYFEPLIRARKGWLTESQVWAEFLQRMPRGLRVLERDGLKRTNDYRGMYWAGAAVALMADAEALRQSGGRRGLQQGLRAVLRAGGHASRVWSLSDAIRVIDQALGAPIVQRLAKRYRSGGKQVPLGQLFTDLGVVRAESGVRFDDDAPLAFVREAINRGAP